VVQEVQPIQLLEALLEQVRILVAHIIMQAAVAAVVITRLVLLLVV
jgi:hypothetical protein